MPAKSPLGKIKDVADVAVVSVVSTVSGTVKDPVGTGQKVVGQALGVAGAVASRVPGLKKSTPERPEPSSAKERDIAPVVPLPAEATKVQGDPVKPAPKKAAGTKPTARKAAAKKAPSAKAATAAPAKKSPAKKSAAKKSASKKAPAKKPAAPTEPPASAEPVYTSESGASSAASPKVPDGGEPLLDPATAKAVRSETDVLRRGADRDPED